MKLRDEDLATWIRKVASPPAPLLWTAHHQPPQCDGEYAGRIEKKGSMTWRRPQRPRKDWVRRLGITSRLFREKRRWRLCNMKPERGHFPCTITLSCAPFTTSMLRRIRGTNTKERSYDVTLTETFSKKLCVRWSRPRKVRVNCYRQHVCYPHTWRYFRDDWGWECGLVLKRCYAVDRKRAGCCILTTTLIILSLNFRDTSKLPGMCRRNMVRWCRWDTLSMESARTGEMRRRHLHRGESHGLTLK